GMSSPVNTACTPGTFRAALTSMLLMRACGTGLRKTAPTSVSFRRTSAVYWVRPWTLRAPSRRATGLPMLDLYIGWGGARGLQLGGGRNAAHPAWAEQRQ